MNKIQLYPIELIRFGPPEKSEEQMVADAKRWSAAFLKQIELHREQQEKIMVRAKFCLTSITQQSYGSGRTLRFQPQYDESIPEDKRFAQATPSGSFEMYCDNPAALEQLELGKQYYFDISPVG